MIRRAISFLITLFLVVPASVTAQSALPSASTEARIAPPRLFERVVENEKRAEEALEVYERMERLETRKNANDSSPFSVKVTRVIPSGTGMDKIPLDADGKPPDVAAYRARLESLERALVQLVNGARSQRDAVEKYAKRKRDRAELIDATHNAFLFKFVAEEPRGDLLLAKYEMSPNPAFKPTTRFTVIFPKVHGYVWIEENSGELARAEGDVTDDISIGLFLGKIYKGSHFMEERYEVKPGLWLPSFTQFDFDGRKLFSGFSIHERSFYSNYRYIGPPKEAIEVIRKELSHNDLAQGAAAPAEP